MHQTLLFIPKQEPFFKTLPSILQNDSGIADELHLQPLEVDDEYPIEQAAETKNFIKADDDFLETCNISLQQMHARQPFDNPYSNARITSSTTIYKNGIDHFNKQYCIDETLMKFLLGKPVDSSTDYAFECYCACTNIPKGPSKIQFLNMQHVFRFLEKCELSYSQGIILLQSVFGMSAEIARIYVLAFFSYLHNYRSDNKYFPSKPMFYLYLAEQTVTKMQWKYTNGKSYLAFVSQIQLIKDKLLDNELLLEFTGVLECITKPKDETTKAKLRTFLTTILDIGSTMGQNITELLFTVACPCLTTECYQTLDIDNMFEVMKGFICTKFGKSLSYAFSCFLSVIIVPIKVYNRIETHNGKSIKIYYDNDESWPQASPYF